MKCCSRLIFFGQEPDIPDLIDYMQSGDELKIINAARYLQHLCYSKESVTKDKVKFLVENATSPFYFIQPLGLGSLLVLFPI